MEKESVSEEPGKEKHITIPTQLINMRNSPFIYTAWICTATLFLSACVKYDDYVQPENVYIQVENYSAPVKTVYLPDSTIVLLDAYSSLRYLKSSFNREIWVSGGFYISVHEENKDFILNFDQMSVRSKNAVFTFNCFQAGSSLFMYGLPTIPARLTVVKGEVAVANLNGTTNWATGAAIDILRDRISAKIDWQKEEEVSWTEGFFKFKQVQLFELCDILLRHYSVDAQYYFQDTNFKLYNIYLNLNSDKNDFLLDTAVLKQVSITVKPNPGHMEGWLISPRVD